MAEEYRQRLDNNVEKLVENFKGLIKTAKIKDPANTTRESFQSSIYATTLVQASESLLKLVSEMKLSLALGDFEGMSQNVDTTSDELLKRKDLVSSSDKRVDGLGLLKAIISMARVTKPLDRPQRREPFGARPVFGSFIDDLFSDGELFAAFGTILGSPDSKPMEVALAVDILNMLVVYQGPDRLRSYLASEGKCIPAPASDKERITWTPDSSLFTALLVVFERNEPLRIQLFNLLREIFRVPLGQTNLTSLVEHIYTKFYETYKAECPLVFEAIRTRHDGNTGSEDVDMSSADANKVQFVRAGSIDDEEELYFEKDTETTESSPEFTKNGLSEEEVPCQNRPRSIKLVDYDDDDDESTTKKENISTDLISTSPRGADIEEEERELKLPVRKKKEDEVDTQSFLGGSNVLAQKKAQQSSKKARSPQFKNVFQKISWKLGTPNSSENGSSSTTPAAEKIGGNNSDGKQDDSNSNSVGSDDAAGVDGGNVESAALAAAKRKLALEEVTNSESLLKKAKTCTPISSS
ncbi:Ubiquitin fusion degradation protein 1 [Phytophthora nicotianae]|uniref:Ubiquitin fusion degradation protein 1 n=1 Tax=Phytophthora nicotianae TaxID=4792 RepID=A0A0W8DFV0_PHYNI|nr:Ubiquitin fusion degradation protein 1 [Phytophthora nicotianae]